MKLNQLRDFIAVAKHGSLRAAARELDIAQPSLTKSIQALEAELAAPLFQRTSRGAIVTPVGSALLVRAELIMEELRRAKDEVDQLTSGGSGEVSIGISTAPTLLFLARVLKDFRRQFPDVKLRIVNGIFPIIIPEMKEGRLDFAVGPEPDEKLEDEFAVEVLFENSRVPVCRRDHPLASADSLEQLIAAPWLVTSTARHPLPAFQRIFTERKLPPPENVTLCEASLALVELLIHSDMICWLPRQWPESAFLSPWISEIPIRDPELKGPNICIVKRRNLPLTPAAEFLATLMRRASTYYEDRRRQHPVSATGLPGDSSAARA